MEFREVGQGRFANARMRPRNGEALDKDELALMNSRTEKAAKALARKAANLAPLGGISASRFARQLEGRTPPDRSPVLNVAFIKWARF